MTAELTSEDGHSATCSWKAGIHSGLSGCDEQTLSHPTDNVSENHTDCCLTTIGDGCHNN